MKLEDQVVSLELAKRLKEFGVTQKSAFYWATSEVKCGTVSGELDLELSNYASGDYDNCSAFTVAELGEMLPGVAYGGRSFPTNIVTFKGWLERDGFQCGFLFNKEFLEKSFHAATEADARAKMLCHLIEKGVVKP